MSAGHVRLSHAFTFFLAGSFDTIWWRAQSRHKSQYWLSWFGCTPQIRTTLLSVGLMFLSVGHMSLSLTFFFQPQAIPWKWPNGPNPGWNINIDEADIPVRLKFDQVCWALSLCFIEWCSCASWLSFQDFFLAGPSTWMTWRARSRHKFRHWPSWVCCTPLNGTFIQCQSCASFLLVLRAPLPWFQEVCF